MAFQVITDTAYADKLWEMGLLYCCIEDGEWFPDDSYLPIYQGTLSTWAPSQSTDMNAPQYAIYVED